MITGNKKASPARPASDPQNADIKDNPIVAINLTDSTNSLVNRLNNRRCVNE